MKNKVAALSILLLLVVSYPVAAQKNSARPIFLETPITIDGAEVPEGVYSLTIESNNSSVRITLSKEGNFVATARGTWVKSGVKYTENVILLRVNSNGTRSLLEIRLAGASKAIVLKNTETIVRFGAH